MSSFSFLPSRSRTLLILVMIQNHTLNVYMNWPGLELFPLFLAKCSNNTKNSVVADNTYLCYWRRLIWTTTIPFASNLLSDINIRFHVIVAASCPNLPVCVWVFFVVRNWNWGNRPQWIRLLVSVWFGLWFRFAPCFLCDSRTVFGQLSSENGVL